MATAEYYTGSGASLHRGPWQAAAMAHGLHMLLGRLDVAIAEGDHVLELGCGEGAATGEIAARCEHVIALEADAEALDRAQTRNARWHNITWALSDGETLAGIEDASIDAAVASTALHQLRSARDVLGHVAELGRVLAPGGWAAFALSTDPAAPTEEAPRQHSRRELFRALGGRGPAARPRETAVRLEALGAVATEAGLILDRIEGSGTPDTVVLARRGSDPVNFG